MRKYLEHMQNKDPHERRAHALRVAGAVVAVVFVGWLGTLGMRLSTTDTTVAQNPGTTDQAAAVAEARPQTGPRLEVSTTSVFLPTYSQ